MIKQAILAIAALSSVACGIDPRTAEITVEDPALMGPVTEAIQHWSNATGGDVSFRMTNECKSDACVTIRVYEVLGDIAKTRTDDSDPMQYKALMRISAWATVQSKGFLSSVIAHELGHVLDLNHTDDITGVERTDAELMTAEDFGNSEGHACIGEETCKLYNKIYDGECNVTCW